MPACENTRNAMAFAHTNIGTPMKKYAWKSSLKLANRSFSGLRGRRRRRSASGFSLMRDILATQSVSIEIIIISMDDRICGRPKNTVNNIGHNSQKVPAGRRYKITFFKLSYTSLKISKTDSKGKSLPYSIQTTMEENDSKRT
jgi:hypothetical protein